MRFLTSSSFKSMLWYSPDIAVDPGCQPRVEVTSFEDQKQSFPARYMQLVTAVQRWSMVVWVFKTEMRD